MSATVWQFEHSEFEYLFMYLLAICVSFSKKWASLVAIVVKNLLANAEDIK